jgi:hypothetical protein
MEAWTTYSLHAQNISLVLAAATELARHSQFEPLEPHAAEACVMRELAEATLAAFRTAPRTMQLEDLQKINEAAAMSASRTMLFGGSSRSLEARMQAAHESSRHARFSKTDDALKNHEEERKLKNEEALIVRRALADARMSHEAAREHDNRM